MVHQWDSENWLPVHIRNISMLTIVHHERPLRCSEIREAPSAMGMDQVHKQEDELIKCHRINRKAYSTALHRWIVAGTEIARLVSVFE